MCLISISRSLELKKNIKANLKSHPLFYFCKKYLECPKLGENRSHLKTRLYLQFQNGFLTQMKLKIQVQEIGKVIQVLKFFLKSF